MGAGREKVSQAKEHVQRQKLWRQDDTFWGLKEIYFNSMKLKVWGRNQSRYNWKDNKDKIITGFTGLVQRHIAPKS